MSIRLVCPTDAAHGALVPWTHNPDFGWYCPDQDHDGFKDRPQTRAFFATSEVGASRPAVDPSSRRQTKTPR